MSNTTVARAQQLYCGTCDQVVVPGVACNVPVTDCPAYRAATAQTRGRDFVSYAATLALPEEFDAIRGDD